MMCKWDTVSLQLYLRIHRRNYLSTSNPLGEGSTSAEQDAQLRTASQPTETTVSSVMPIR